MNKNSSDSSIVDNLYTMDIRYCGKDNAIRHLQWLTTHCLEWTHSLCWGLGHASRPCSLVAFRPSPAIKDWGTGTNSALITLGQNPLNPSIHWLVMKFPFNMAICGYVTYSGTRITQVSWLYQSKLGGKRDIKRLWGALVFSLNWLVSAMFVHSWYVRSILSKLSEDGFR